MTDAAELDRQDASPWDVIVVGAGIAGLAAAHDLCARGKRVLVLEARSRVGGRIFSQAVPGLAVPIELGAEFVDRGSIDVARELARFGLTGCDVPEQHWYSDADGVRTENPFWNDVQKALERAANKPDQPFATFLADAFPGARHERLRRDAIAYVEGFHAADVERASTHALAAVEQADGFGGSPQMRLLGGASELPLRLAQALPTTRARMQLGAAVTAVRWRRGEVEVETRSLADAAQPTLRARAAVITVPLPLLAEPEHANAIRFDPPLPAKVAAAQRLATGDVVRVVLQFAEPLWERVRRPAAKGSVSFEDAAFVHSPAATFRSWWTTVPVRTPLLTGWIAGPPTRVLGERSERSWLGVAIESLAGTLGVTTAELHRALRSAWWHDWLDDPWARGAYSYVPVGGVGARAELAVPVDGTLFFAGEATAADDASTIHGAFTSGRRAARELLDGA